MYEERNCWHSIFLTTRNGDQKNNANDWTSNENGEVDSILTTFPYQNGIHLINK